MIIVDTNVVSEFFRPRPNPAVVAWLDEQPARDLYLCAPVVAELSYGVAKLPESRRRGTLRDLVADMVETVFQGRVLPFDWHAANHYGAIVSAADARGQPIATIDAMIAAIAVSNNATVAMRNMKDFLHTGVALVNPFEADP